MRIRLAIAIEVQLRNSLRLAFYDGSSANRSHTFASLEVLLSDQITLVLSLTIRETCFRETRFRNVRLWFQCKCTEEKFLSNYLNITAQFL